MYMQSDFLKIAIEAAQKAEKVLLDGYGQNLNFDIKESDHSPVTLIDKQAEKIIKETIIQAFPDHGFLGEEEGSSNTDSEYVWIIDPLDGTKEYIRHIPLFSTQISLVKNGDFILGLSNA